LRVNDEATISVSEQLIRNKLAQKEYAVFKKIFFLIGYANFIFMLAQSLFFRNWLEQQNRE